MQINELSYKVYIGKDRTEWPEAVAPINRITIFERVLYAVAAAEIVIHDAVGVIGKKFDLKDGTEVQLEISARPGLVDKWDMLVAKVHSIDGQLYRITLVENQPKWFYAANIGSFKGTSSALIKKLASDCSLEATVDDTSDSQVWLGFGRKNYVFARQSGLRGYVSDKSLMCLAYYRKRLLYKDLNAIDTSKPETSFRWSPPQDGSKRILTLSSVESISTSGIDNARAGYRRTLIDQEAQTFKETKQENVEVKKRTPQTQISSEVRGKIDKAPTMMAPLSSDNTHKKYNRALYQNLRGLFLLHQGIRLTTPFPSKLGLFEAFDVQVGEMGANVAPSNPNKLLDGVYLLDSKITQVSGGQYSELLVGRREGIQNL